MDRKEQIKKAKEKYRNSPNGKKKRKIDSWKGRGLIDDYEKVFEIYMETTECMRCSVPISGRGKHMDHDHITKLYRAVLCRSCNVGNHLDLHPRKTNKLGIKYIQECYPGSFRFFKGNVKSTSFKTIEEAVIYKNNYLKSL